MNVWLRLRSCLTGLAAVLAASTVLPAGEQTLTFLPAEGRDQGKHIVLISGDEEYRSEEALPQLARILSKHHGFKCTVLFAIDPADGTIKPTHITNIPGLESLDTADLLILFTRWRDLPEAQMACFDRYFQSGKPIIGLRTATHAFKLPADSPYVRYTWNSGQEGWKGGFGKNVLGETWVSHHGKHGGESTRGILAEAAKSHPVVRGLKDGDIWGPTDVYGVHLPLPGDSQPLVLGQIVAGMSINDPAVEGKKNDPMMPIAWVKTYDVGSGKRGRVFTSTMASSQDLESAGLRRLFVNATYWALGLEDAITPDLDVSLVGEYKPRPFSHGGFKHGVKPSDLADK